MTRMILSDEQEAAVAKMLANPTRRALNGSEMGTGKTAMAIELGLRLGHKVNLVIAPLHTFDGWESTLQRQTNGEQSFKRINSKKDGKLNHTEAFFGKPGWYFVGREFMLSLSWTRLPLDYVVWDESHVMQSEGSKSFRVAKQLRHAKYIHLMSGTWFGSQFGGAWTSPVLLWPEWMKDNGWLADNGKGYWKWAERWAEVKKDHFKGLVVSGEKVEGEWVKALPCYVALESDQETPLYQEIRVPLLPSQKKQHDQMEKDALVWLSEQEVMVAELPMTKAMRLMQIALGTINVETRADGTEMVTFPEDSKSAKFEALKSFLSDIPKEKVLIGTASAKFARLVAARLGDKAFAWTGDKSEAERKAAKEAFVNGNLQYIVATQQAISEGTDSLQFAAHIIAILRRSDQVLLNQQFVARLARRGQTERVLVYDFVAEDTLEDKRGASLLRRELAMRGSLGKLGLD